jgi:hypothetical protein
LKLCESGSKNEAVSVFFFSWSCSWSCGVLIRTMWNRFRRIEVQKEMFQQPLKLFGVQLINIKTCKKKLFYFEEDNNKQQFKKTYTKKSSFYYLIIATRSYSYENESLVLYSVKSFLFFTLSKNEVKIISKKKWNYIQLGDEILTDWNIISN